MTNKMEKISIIALALIAISFVVKDWYFDTYPPRVLTAEEIALEPFTKTVEEKKGNCIFYPNECFCTKEERDEILKKVECAMTANCKCNSANPNPKNQTAL